MDGAVLCFAKISRGRHRENLQGKDIGGFKVYLEGIAGHPSLVNNLGKTSEKNLGKLKNTHIVIHVHICIY